MHSYNKSKILLQPLWLYGYSWIRPACSKHCPVSSQEGTDCVFVLMRRVYLQVTILLLAENIIIFPGDIYCTLNFCSRI